ncbi:mobilization protein [Streptomyces sp. NPDC088360]|uniref:relaxase/mobilization nuclease domain-containing protein n=1 Tax=Streptomyces sp. NPDC088360 TaxID=3154515 RepID=UPI00344E926C
MMPKKARDGTDTGGLLAYLYGPGKRDEHVDAHLVAAWEVGVPDPGRDAGATISDLALLLDAPVWALAGKKPAEHVYHVAVRNAPEDRVLSDAEWAEVAREMMHAAGVAGHGDEQGCRWVAVRHAEDHIHIVATKARQDHRQPNLRRDIVKMQAAARVFEARWGLRALVSGDRTAQRWPTTGEREKAAARGLAQTARESLQEQVREVAAQASGDADFFARLEASGLRVRSRVAPDGNVTGYSVALPGDRDGARRAVWFSGSRLAWDLSLPRVRERWSGEGRAGAVAPGEAWRVAEEKCRLAARVLGAGGAHRGAGDVMALGDLVVVTALVAPALVRAELRSAARDFERASRAPGARELEGQARKLSRDSAQALRVAVAASGRSDAVATLGFLVALVEAVAASQRWHQAQGYRAQAQSAGAAGRLLRQAVEVTTGAAAARKRGARAPRGAVRPGGALGQRGTTDQEPLMAGVVQRSVPDHARQVLADTAWPALRTQLARVGQSGGDPETVLAAVAAQRELGTADSVAEVLTWRLEGWTRGRAQAGSQGTAGQNPAVAGGGRGSAAAAKKSAAADPRRTPGADGRGPGRAR